MASAFSTGGDDFRSILTAFFAEDHKEGKKFKKKNDEGDEDGEVETDDEDEEGSEEETDDEDNETNEDLVGMLEKLLAGGQDIFLAISAAVTAGELAPLSLGQVRRLQYIKTLSKTTAQDQKLMCFLLQDRSIRFKDWSTRPLVPIALKYYYSTVLPVTRDDTLVKFRSELFSTEALAVLLASMIAEKLLRGHKLKDAIQDTLLESVKRGVPIVSAEFHDMTHEKDFISKTNLKTEKELSEVHEMLKALQRLQCLVTDPHHIDSLIQANFLSAHDIAVLDQAKFVAIITTMLKGDLAVSDADCRKIHDHATAIDCRNQETWARVLISIKDDFIALGDQAAKPKPQAVVLQNANDKKSGASGSISAKVKTLPTATVGSQAYNMTEIFNLQSSGCEDCCSVTSASAYFVDLLNFLRASSCDSSKKGFSNALQALSSRRPDLEDLELSCSNSKDMLPYIALTNEVLESFINSRCVPGDQELDHEHSSSISLSASQKVGVFGGHIAKQMYPMMIYPYNQALEEIDVYLSSMGMSMLEIMNTFRSEALLLAQFPDVDFQDSKSQKAGLGEASAVYNRAIVAETLKLKALDFAVITREQIYQLKFIDLLSGLSIGEAEHPIGNLKNRKVPETCLSWGYDNNETMLSVEEQVLDAKAVKADEDEEEENEIEQVQPKMKQGGQGLCFIRRQLLHRSGLSFEELLEICNSLYFGTRLVITNAKRVKTFSDQLSDMRLLCLDITAKGDTPPVGPLTEEICHELQGFIRLRNRLGWSISELDVVLSSLTENQTKNGIPSPPKGSRGITSRMLEDIAYVVRLSSLSELPVVILSSLWATINAHGKGSVYDKVFVGPAARLGAADIFKPDARNKFFEKGNETFANHLPVLKAALRLSSEAWEIFLNAAGVEADQKLSLERLSQIYRHSVLCKILKVQPKDYDAVRSLIAGNNDIFQDPITTFTSVEAWSRLHDNGWSVAEILASSGTTGIATGKAEPVERNILDLAHTIADKANMLNKQWILKVEERRVTSQDVLEICSQLFDGPTAKVVSSFIEGISVNTESVEFSSTESVPDKAKLPHRLSAIKDLSGSGKLTTLTVRGVMSDEELKAVKDASQKGGSFISGVEKLHNSSKLPLQALKSRIYSQFPPEKQEFATKLFLEDVEKEVAVAPKPKIPQQKKATPSMQKEATAAAAAAAKEIAEQQEIAEPDELVMAEQKEIEKQTRLTERRVLFVRLALPTLRTQIILDSTLQAVSEKIPGLDQTILHLLLKGSTEEMDAAVSQTKSPLQSLEDVQYLSDDVKHLKAAYFSPTATDIYRFELPNNQESIQFSINGINVPLNDESPTRKSDPVMMSTGQTYLLNSSTDISNLRWSTQQSVSTKFNNATLLPYESISSVTKILHGVGRTAELVKKLELTLEEFKYFIKPDGFLPLDLGAKSVTSLCKLQAYRELRDSVDGEHRQLIRLFEWLKNSTKSEGLAARLAAATGWQETQIDIALELKFRGMTGPDIIGHFRSIDGLTNFQRIIETLQRIKPAPGRDITEPIELLFKVATPTAPGRIEEDFSNALSFQSCLAERQLVQCMTEVREKQRTALVHYLLQQPYIREERKIFDADGLFDYFLMDVQMGAKLETTRMKQAISVVQLYVQRCILGLEVDEGIKSSNILPAKWAWMQKHNVWQATRKAFLYPENWIDPSLRDDKTAVFDDYESSIMQKDLNWKTFSTAIRGYVQGLSEIADLNVLAYVRQNDSDSDVYHFFGRTHSAPYGYYYRKMRLIIQGCYAFWSPWSKIELEATTYEADYNGETLETGGNYMIPVMRGKRLFLYLPQIMSKAVSPKPPQEPAKDGAKEKPSTFVDLTTKPVGSTESQKTWEVRIAWTEFVDGRWLPKRVSQSSIVVDWAPEHTAEPLPSIANFNFSTYQDGDTLKIRGSYWRAKGKAVYSLGEFAIKDDRIVAIKAGKQRLPNAETLPTVFQKYSWVDTGASKSIVAPGGKAYANGKAASPLLALPQQGTRKKRNLTWTLSYGDEIRSVTGLVVDEKFEGTSGRSVFIYPIMRPLPTVVDSVAYTNTSGVSNNEVIEHESSQLLLQAVCDADSIEPLYNVMASLSPSEYGKARLSKGLSSYHELATSYSLYNWELGLHTILMAMDRFHATQQFELALRAARMVFDPTVDPSPGHTTPWTACWKFPPFTEIAANRESISDQFNGWPEDNLFELAVAERRSNPSNAHATARGRPQAYMKWIVMKYIEILVAAGDEYFRQGSLEALPLAIQRYIEANHVLGPEPPKMPKMGKAAVMTFRDLGTKTKVDLELAFPFMCNVEKRGSEDAKDSSTASQKLLCILQTSYFCLPPNPRYQALRSLVQDRLFKIRNNLDIQGRPIVYSIIEPELDPAAVARALSGGGAGISSLLNDMDSPMPFHRFSFLITKALEMCGELRSLGEQFLQAKEKRDGEAFSLLKARQDCVKQALGLEIRQLQRHEIEKTIESLLLNRESAASQLSFYLQLIGEPLSNIPDEKGEWEDIKQTIEQPTTDDTRMNYYEAREMKMADYSTVLNLGASAMDVYTSMLRSMPIMTTTFEPMGVGVTVRYDSHMVAESVHGCATAVRMLATIASEDAHKSARKATLTRQLQDRRLQANMRGRDIKSIDKQIEIQKKRLDINDREVALQGKEVEFATETEKWYRSKYTNENLYAWMENSVRALHYDLYLLTADLARRAEKSLRFERGSQPLAFLRTGGYWDSSHDGLLAAQQLNFDLRRLEIASIDKRAYDFEIAKSFSLRQMNPLALIDLRETGTALFELPELLFDIDFPGHYMRRIRSVALSIPCLVGPHTTLAATLSLVEHKYRVSAAAAKGEDYHDLTGENAHADQFRTDRVPITQVAISSGIQDTGTFELGAGDSERFQPFEGAGAVSKWRLTLPTTVRQFDYQTISDVVLHMRYTAADGGPLLRRAANEAVASFQASIEDLGQREGLYAFFDLKNDFSNQWYAFQATLSLTKTKRQAVLDLSDLSDRLPFWARGKTVTVLSAAVLVKGQDKTVADDLTLSLDTLLEDEWDPTKVGKSILLTRANVGVPLVGMKLVVTKDAGGVSGIEGLSLVIRYSIGKK